MGHEFPTIDDFASWPVNVDEVFEAGEILIVTAGQYDEQVVFQPLVMLERQSKRSIVEQAIAAGLSDTLPMCIPSFLLSSGLARLVPIRLWKATDEGVHTHHPIYSGQVDERPVEWAAIIK